MRNRWWTITFALLLALVALSVAGCGAEPTPVAPATPKPAAEGPSGPAAQPATASGTLEGVVLDAATGKPLEKVMVQTNPGTPGAMTDAQGKFTIADVPVGMYNLQANLSGYDVGFEGNLSIVAGGTQDVQLDLQAADSYPVADVRGVWPSDGEVYPDNKVWITLGAGYGMHDNNKISTSGLSNVGVGTYVYLEGREVDGEGNAISGWTWQAIDPGGQAVAVENADSRTPRFLATKEGAYRVVCEADIEGVGKGQTMLTVNAGRYVGAQVCQGCHNGSLKPDTYSPWLNTGHGTKFETTYASYTAERDYCIGCHVTGYNETADNGGFDELARKTGWDAALGSLTSWLFDAGQTMQQVKDSPMGELTSVQCEACHGPGSVHTEASSYDPAVCEQCHTQGEQWESSGHALTGYNSAHTAGNASCAPCHTGEGYVQATIRGQQLVFPSDATPLQPANMSIPGEQPAIACATCHDPHAATNSDENGTSTQLRQHGDVAIPAGITVHAGEAATCVSCHADKRDAQYKASFLAGEQVRGPHDDTQADILFGVKESVFDFGEPLSSDAPHATETENLCITCHMAANPVLDPGPDGEVGTRDDVLAPNIGGHSFSMAADIEGKGLLENTQTCANPDCHGEAAVETFNRKTLGDYDGDGQVEGVQDEVKGLLALLEEKLPKDENGAVVSSTIKPDNTTEVERQAIWNYWVIASDGSFGVHNATFTIQLLQKTYQHLTGEPVPNAAVR